MPTTTTTTVIPVAQPNWYFPSPLWTELHWTSRDWDSKRATCPRWPVWLNILSSCRVVLNVSLNCSGKKRQFVPRFTTDYCQGIPPLFQTQLYQRKMCEENSLIITVSIQSLMVSRLVIMQTVTPAGCSSKHICFMLHSQAGTTTTLQTLTQTCTVKTTWWARKFSLWMGRTSLQKFAPPKMYLEIQLLKLIM